MSNKIKPFFLFAFALLPRITYAKCKRAYISVWYVYNSITRAYLRRPLRKDARRFEAKCGLMVVGRGEKNLYNKQLMENAQVIILYVLPYIISRDL